MRNLLSLILLFFLVPLPACGGLVDSLAGDPATPVIRTDFSDEAIWKKLQEDLAAGNSMGFSANIRFIDEKQYSSLTGPELLQELPGLVEYGCIFIADATSMSSPEHHLLVLDPINPEGSTFRVIPAEVWSVENNLSLANMDFSEFAGEADPDGVFRGFK